MTTGGDKNVAYGLVNKGALTLEHPNRNPRYNGIVICRDMIIVIDISTWKVRFHRLHDGKLLATSNRLESLPRDICLVSDKEICVILENGLIEIMSLGSTDTTGVITPTRTLNVQGVLDEYRGVVRINDDLVVCGVKQDMMYWCIVSVNKIHQICKGYESFDFWNESFMTTKGSMIYISCRLGLNSPDNGVYGYDIVNPSKCKYTYKHKDLCLPSGITIDKDGFMFVCNYGLHYFIHQLTDKCQLVSIFTQGIPCLPMAIFWDQGHGHLYLTCDGSDKVTIFTAEYQDKEKSGVTSDTLPAVLVPKDYEDDKQGIDGRKQLLTAETSAKMEQGIQTNDPVEQIYYRISDLTAYEKHKLLLPPGKKYHVFFCYASSDIQWVKETVERLENDHGFVCCEYDRDNTPGTSLLPFAGDSIKDACKTVVVMTKEAFKSGFVRHEIQMALQQGFDTGRKCVVPVLLQDCTVPDYLRILNYVDARDRNQRDIWWPKLLTELQSQAGKDNAPEDPESNQETQHLGQEPSSQLEHGDA